MGGRQVRGESPPHLDRDRGDSILHGETSFDDANETGSEQLGEMSGQPHILPLPGCADQTEKLGDGTGTERGHPEPADVGIRRGDASLRGDESDRDRRTDAGGGSERSTHMPHGTIGWRTILATCGCSGSHTRETYK